MNRRKTTDTRETYRWWIRRADEAPPVSRVISRTLFPSLYQITLNGKMLVVMMVGGGEGTSGWKERAVRVLLGSIH